MAGLESDTRAGAVRVDPNSIVARPADLSPAVAQLADAFRKGMITADNIIDRYGTAAIAKEKAEVAEAGAKTRVASAITPELIQLRTQAEQGGLEAQIAQQEFAKTIRDPAQKIQKMQVSQALQELETGLPSETLRQLEFQYPHIIKPQRDAEGRVLNVAEVRSQIGHAVRTQRLIDQAKDLTSQFETKEVQTSGGQEGLQTFWKGTNTPVPPEILQFANQARTGALWQMQPGELQAAAPAAAPAAAGAAPAAGAPAAATGEVNTGLPVYQPGQVTPEGVFITKQRAGGKLTEVEGKALKFYRRMEESENFYNSMLQKGFEPTKAATQASRDIWSSASKVPVLGAVVGKVIPDDAKSYHNVVQGFTSAMLRDESGAAIRDDERAEYERMMFPLTEEPPEVVAQKARLRATVMASLKQVSSGQISDEAYEQAIEEITGRQFPAATSVRSPARLGEAASQGVAPDDIPRIKPGDPIPQSGWFWVEGEAFPRKAFQPRQAPPPAQTPPLSQAAPQITPRNKYETMTPTSVSGIRG